jgi:hypothetical protein
MIDSRPKLTGRNITEEIQGIITLIPNARVVIKRMYDIIGMKIMLAIRLRSGK